MKTESLKSTANPCTVYTEWWQSNRIFFSNRSQIKIYKIICRTVAVYRIIFSLYIMYTPWFNS